MRKVIVINKGAKFAKNTQKKPSPQTVPYKLDKGFEKKLKLLLNITPTQVEELKVKWKGEREEGKKKQSSN